MGAQFGQLLSTWSGNIDELIGMHWSRKHNGFSVIWDGGITLGMKIKDIPWVTLKRLDNPNQISTGLWTLGRNAKNSWQPLPKVLNAPMSFVSNLPKGIPLHGELCTEDDDLQYIKKVCRLDIPRAFKWKKIKFMAFAVKPYSTFYKIDMSSVDGWLEWKDKVIELEESNEYFYNYPQCRFNLSQLEPNVNFEIIEQHKINSKQQALEAIDIFNASNWEGLCFTNMSARYSNKRTKNTLKYKPDYENEARIIGYVEGKTGKNIGKLGGLEVEMIWDDNVQNIHGGKPEFIGKNVTFAIGSGFTDVERDLNTCEALFPIGKEIKFSYKVISEHGIPQHCSIYRGM